MTPEHSPEQRLAALGIELPEAPAPVATYIPCVQAGGMLHISGQIPIRDGSMLATGSVPDAVSIEEAAACARWCAVNALAVAKAELGELCRVERVVRLGCFVACGPGFGGHPEVANGASELMGEVFGEAGRHARAAVGCPSLPRDVPVELEVTLAVRPA